MRFDLALSISLTFLAGLFSVIAKADASTHLVTLEAKATRFSTQNGASSTSVFSPLGIGLTYTLHATSSWALSAQGVSIFGPRNVLLYGAGVRADFALIGGQNKVYRGPEAFSVAYQYPFRVGLFLGGVQRTYSLAGYVQQETVTFQKKIPLRGSFVGPELGVSADIPAGPNSVFVARVGYVHPLFLSEPEQKGSVVSVSLGMGTFL